MLFSFPCSTDHERDWPLCKVVFSGWQPIGEWEKGLGAFCNNFSLNNNKPVFMVIMVWMLWSFEYVQVLQYTVRKIRTHLDLLSIPQSGGKNYLYTTGIPRS